MYIHKGEKMQGMIAEFMVNLTGMVMVMGFFLGLALVLGLIMIAIEEVVIRAKRFAVWTIKKLSKKWREGTMKKDFFYGLILLAVVGLAYYVMFDRLVEMAAYMATGLSVPM